MALTLRTEEIPLLGAPPHPTHPSFPERHLSTLRETEPEQRILALTLPNVPSAFPGGLQAPTLQRDQLLFFSDFRVLSQLTLLHTFPTNALDLPADSIQKHYRVGPSLCGF